MCGIIGYAGHRAAVPVVIEGLRSLEYRGYDSAGIGFVQNHKLEVIKAAGKLNALEDKLIANNNFMTTYAIGHTRWATHGAPVEYNAHPHVSNDGKICLVHNGIIENYQEIKKELQMQGYKFVSDTDTEVLVNLISEERKVSRDMLHALAKALNQITGTYAIVAFEADKPEVLYGARIGSPLLIGVGTGEMFLASDIPAFLHYTNDVIFLEEGEITRITNDEYAVYLVETLLPVTKKLNKINWDVQTAKKSGFKHFMLKEIFEQPKVIRDCLSGRVINGDINISEIENCDIPEKLTIIACGTSYHAGLWARYILEKFAKIPTQVEIASEFRYRDIVFSKNEVALAISQSGETADTLACVKMVKNAKIPVIGLCNVIGSSISRDVDYTIYTQAGPEISVASTKAMCSQMSILLLVALYWGKKKQIIDRNLFIETLFDLDHISENLEKVIPILQKKAQEISRKYSKAQSFFFLGRGLNFPLALEGALKLKEISYIHAEGYAAGEMKHGPIALIDEQFPTLALVTQDLLYAKTKSNIQEIQARDGKIVALTTEGADIKADDKWLIPQLQTVVQSFYILPALQLFAYEMAVFLGKDVDQPRNLAKSVTVE